MSDQLPSEVDVRHDTLGAWPTAALAAVLDVEPPTTVIPPLWSWVHFLETVPHSQLGPDGHALQGIPRPPDPGMRRMWAGGDVSFHAPLLLGEPAQMTIGEVDKTHKQGTSGPLHFHRVRHEIVQRNQVVVTDDRTIVYRPLEGTPAPTGGPSGEVDPDFEVVFTQRIDESLLFRFSALTYNAHRIHYDRSWCEHEGYSDLVVHGPLQALLMAEALRRSGIDLVGHRLAYRLVAPLIGPQHAAVARADSRAVVRDASGRVTAKCSVSPAASPPSHPISVTPPLGNEVPS